MTKDEKETIRLMAEQEIAAHPERRIFSFEWDGKTYWIKKKQGNGRNSLVKYSVEKEFYYEIAHISIAASAVDSVPDVVLLTDTYMVMRDGGRNIKDQLASDMPEEKKLTMLCAAGEALAKLHHAELYHGRPAMRDMTWDGSRVRFLDWENRTYFTDLPRRQIMDVLLFFQGMYREHWMTETYVAAAWEGYEKNGGAALLANAADFLRAHGTLLAIVRALHSFHFKDVESVEKTAAYFLKRAK